LEYTVLGFLFDSSKDVENEFFNDWNLTRPEEELFDLNLSYFKQKIDS